MQDMEGEDPLKVAFTFPRPSWKGVRDMVPIIEFTRTYQLKNYIGGDIIAGVIVGVMLIPQGMAYSLLATLPPEYGIYSSIVGIIIYAMFGSSRQLAVGPVAVVSLLVAEAIEKQGIESSEEKVHFAMLLAFFTGLFSTIFGLLRAGILSRFISHAVLVGFTAGAAIVIGLSQLKAVLGFSIPRYSYPIQTVIYALGHLNETNVTTLVMSIVAMIYLYSFKVLKRYNASKKLADDASTFKRISKKALDVFCSFAALEVIIIGTLATKALYDNHGYTKDTLPIVGFVPSGFPAPSASFLNFSQYDGGAGAAMAAALVIAILGFMESFAVGSSVAQKHGQRIDANKELFALGMANLLGSFFNIFPVTGGFSRTAVNDNSGANSPYAALISAGVLIITIFFLTDAFFYMPKNVLAAIILVAVSGLFHFESFKFTFHSFRLDFYISMITAIATVCLGTEMGLLVGIGISVAFIFYKLAFPHTAELGSIVAPHGETVYRNLARFPNASREECVSILRVDAPIIFLNSENIVFKVRQLVQHMRSDTQEKVAVVLSMEGVEYIDSAALEMFIELQEELEKDDVSLIGCNMKGPVRDAISKFNNRIEAQVAKSKDDSKLMKRIFVWRDLDSKKKIICASMMVSTVEEALSLFKESAREDIIASV